MYARCLCAQTVHLIRTPRRSIEPARILEARPRKESSHPTIHHTAVLRHTPGMNHRAQRGNEDVVQVVDIFQNVIDRLHHLMLLNLPFRHFAHRL